MVLSEGLEINKIFTVAYCKFALLPHSQINEC